MPNRRGRQRAIDSRKQQRRKVASQQIDKLVNYALAENKTKPEIAERHAEIAWKLSTRFNVRLGEKRLFFCHKCKKFIVPPDTTRIRLSKRRKGLNITCLRCQTTYRKII
ncbi:MAG: RNase P subunit [Nitrososphaerales archaeon]